MYKALLNQIVATVRKRDSEGDCPVDPRPSGETLEDCILELASVVEIYEATLLEIAQIAPGFTDNPAVMKARDVLIKHHLYVD